MRASVPAEPGVLASRRGDLWARGPAAPRLEHGEVHVWRADLTEASDRLAGAAGVVAALPCADEGARGNRISRDTRQRMSRRAARAVLRLLIARYLDCRPGKLRFEVGEHGKPRLSPSFAPSVGRQFARGDTTALHFNLSHSGTTTLYAFSRDAEVGVDVEIAGRERNYVAIARRMFGEVEAERLQRLDRSSRELEFLRVWSKLEAELKCRGTGFGGTGPRSVTWITELDLGPCAAGALASEHYVRTLRCWNCDHAAPGSPRRRPEARGR